METTLSLMLTQDYKYPNFPLEREISVYHPSKIYD